MDFLNESNLIIPEDFTTVSLWDDKIAQVTNIVDFKILKKNKIIANKRSVSSTGFE